MPKITFIEDSGTEHTVDAQVGESVMQVAVNNSVPGHPRRLRRQLFLCNLSGVCRCSSGKRVVPACLATRERDDRVRAVSSRTTVV